MYQFIGVGHNLVYLSQENIIHPPAIFILVFFTHLYFLFMLNIINVYLSQEVTTILRCPVPQHEPNILHLSDIVSYKLHKYCAPCSPPNITYIQLCFSSQNQVRLVSLVTIYTLHNFQFYLAYIWTDLQSCL